ncbi:hypothetical protein Tco_0926891 [Tanacetum coccineum]|uniref:Retrotransposon gag domain-containing protein n=1 Tax=Tanacetum coccineum TaxID=301880 RepID=A0ABQ5DC82_9ASTR
MEEYIRLEEEKAQKCGKVFNWETSKYGKIWYEDIHDLRSVEIEFSVIAFNDEVSSKTLSYKPTVSSLNDKIDFKVSFNDSDDEDYMVIFDKNLFSYKKISTNDLKTDLENDNEKVMPSLPIPDPAVSCLDDLEIFKDFENEFPAIFYNDAPTSKSDLLIELILSPQHIDEFDLNNETSLSEYDEEEQNVLYFNDLFPFNIIHADDLKLEKDNDDNDIDIIQSSEDMAPLPPHDQRHLWLRYQVEGYTEEIVHDFEQRLETIFGRQVNRVHILDFERLTPNMRQDLVERMRMVYTGDDGQEVFRSYTWRRLFGIRAPLVHEFILEFFCTCGIEDEMALGLHTTKEMTEDRFGAYWLGSERLIPDKGELSDYWVEISSGSDFLRGAPLYTYIRDPNDRGAANIPYLLAQYLFRHAERRKCGARLSGGYFIRRLAHHFGLVSDDGLRGLSVVARELLWIDMESHTNDEGQDKRPIPFPSHLNGYYCEEKKGSYGPQFSEAYSEASHINNSNYQKGEKEGTQGIYEDIKVPLILGRPFLSTARAMELDLEDRLMGETLVLNRSLDPFLEDYIELNDLNEPFELRRNQGDDLMPTIEEGEKDMDAYRDEGMGDVIFGEPFLREVGIKARRFEGIITIYNGDDEVTYQMVRSHPRFKHHTNEQCNKIPPLLKCMTRSSANELFTPYKEPEREFRSSRRHFKTLSLDELRSPDFNLLSDQEYSEEEVAETMAETMEQYMSKTRADYGSGVARPKIEDKDNFELKGQFLKELRTNTFSGSDHEDANEHIEKVLEIVDLFHIPNITIDQVMLRAFPMSLTGAASRWLRNKPTGSITTWEDLKTKFLSKYCLLEVVLFYNILDVPTRQILDSRGEIPSKTVADAKTTIQEMAEYSQKWHNGTSRVRSTETSNGLAAIHAQLNNLGREIKKGIETQTTPGYYQRNNANPSYQERRQSMEDTPRKLMNAAIRNQGASIKTSEIQIKQMSKNNTLMYETIQTTILFLSHLNGYYCKEKKGSYGPQFSKADSKASHIGNSIPRKEKDPGSFTLPCFINNVCFDNALVDLGASVSVMPLSTYLNLGLGELAQTKLTVELADRTVKYPKGIV